MTGVKTAVQNNTPDAERGTETAEHSADRQATNAVASRRAGSLTRWLYRLQTPAALRLGGDDEERRRAEVELRKRSDDLVGEALLAMRLLPRTRPSQVLDLSGVFVLPWIVGALAVWTVDRRVGADFSIWTAVGPSMASVLAAVAARRRQRELAANWLAVQKDTRVIGPLADAMGIVSRRDRARVAAGLAEALEHCRRED